MAGLSNLESLLGINTSAGDSALQGAYDTINGVKVPDVSQLTLPQLQQYVSAGVLTPQQYQAILTDPETYNKVVQNTDQSGTNAQKSALQQLGGIAKTGSTPIMQAQLYDALQQQNQANQAANSGIMQNAQQRGIGGAGTALVAQLLSNQGNASNANSAAVHSAGNNAQLALQALSQQGSLGSSLQGQQNQMSQAQAQAAQQIAEYNSQLQNSAAQYNTTNANQAQQMNLANAQGLSNANTGNANMRTQYNAQLPQQVYQDQMSKANALAGVNTNQAKLQEGQAENQNAFVGNLMGEAGKVGRAYMTGGASLPFEGAGGGGGGMSGTQAIDSGYGSAPTGANANPYNYGINMSGQYPTTGQKSGAITNPYSQYARGGEVCYAQGGEVHDHSLCMKAGGPVPGQASVPGDSPANDTVNAKLSPHEIVLPRSVAMAPNAPQKAAQFVQGVKGQQPQQPGLTPNVNSFAEALKVLEANGVELRLSPKVG